MEPKLMGGCRDSLSWSMRAHELGKRETSTLRAQSRATNGNCVKKFVTMYIGP